MAEELQFLKEIPVCSRNQLFWSMPIVPTNYFPSTSLFQSCIKARSIVSDKKSRRQFNSVISTRAASLSLPYGLVTGYPVRSQTKVIITLQHGSTSMQTTFNYTGLPSDKLAYSKADVDDFKLNPPQTLYA